MIFILASYTAFFTYLYMGYYVYKADPREKLNRYFLTMCILFAFCSLLELLKYNARDDEAIFIINQLSQISWLSYPGFVLSISLIHTRNESFMNNNYMKYGIFAPGFLFIILELFVKNYSIRDAGIFTLVWNVESVYIYLYVFISGCLYLRLYRRTRLVRVKKQTKILLICGTVTLFLATFNDFVIASIDKFYLSLDQFIILIFFFSIWYMNSRYKFLKLTSYITAEDIVDKITDMVVLADPEGLITGINQRVEEALGYKRDTLSGSHLSKIINLDFDLLLRKVKTEKSYFDDKEFYCISSSGQEIPISIKASVVKDRYGDIVGSIIVFQDRTLIKKLKAEIDDRKLKESQLNYLSYHDFLTGLFNRAYFEQEMRKLQSETSVTLGIIMCDLDGLKLINDTLGHDVGDSLLNTAASAIKSSLLNDEILARIGGDEFAVLIPCCTKSAIENICAKIRKAVKEFNSKNPRVILSISLGSALCSGRSKGINEVFKEADDNMYKEKLNHIHSVRNSMVQALMKTLEVRDFVTAGHTERMGELVICLGEYIGLPEQSINNLQLLAQFHDLGKVGIPDSILFKASALNDMEKEQMQRHSEIGYRIAQALPDLNGISEFILKHHERWDGKGYPLGIRGEKIPLECRILAIVDAYDAMINDRPYRKAMTKKAAVKELKNHAGTQFDPQLVPKFLKMLGEKEARENVRTDKQDIFVAYNLYKESGGAEHI